MVRSKWNQFRKKYNNDHKFMISVNTIIIVLVLCLSIGFSSPAVRLALANANAIVRIEEEVRITGISVSSSENGAISNWEEYNWNNFVSNITLPNEDSTITFSTDVVVFSENYYGIYDITGLPSELTYEVDYGLEEMLCDDDNENMCKFGAKRTINITISYAEDAFDDEITSFFINVKYDFKRIYTIEYVNFDSTVGLPEYIMHGNSLDLDLDFNSSVLISMDHIYIFNHIDYEFGNYMLNIPNVTGDLVIRKRGTLAYEVLNSNTIDEEHCPSAMASANSDINGKYYPIDNDESTPMLCSAVDDYGETQYFRGDVQNNYVDFAGATWRIMRVNGDGSVRMILDDSIGQYTYTGKTVSSETRDHAWFGYKRGTLGQANNVSKYATVHSNTEFAPNSVSTKINEWYVNNLQNNYADFLSDTVFCNDREMYNTSIVPTPNITKMFVNLQLVVV